MGDKKVFQFIVFTEHGDYTVEAEYAKIRKEGILFLINYEDTDRVIGFFPTGNYIGFARTGIANVQEVGS